MSHIIAPTRAEQLIVQGSVGLRYITFFEQLADAVTKSNSWENIVVDSATYITQGTERLIVEGIGTITLNTNAEDGETVNVITQAGEVTVQASKLINNEPELTMWINNTSLFFTFIKAKNTWIII